MYLLYKSFFHFMKLLEKYFINLSKSFLQTKGVSFNDFDDAFFVADSIPQSRKKFQNYSSWTGDCADIWGKWFTKAVFRLYEKGDNEEIESHPIISMLNRPNSFQTRWEVLFRVAHHIIYYGNCYLHLQRDKLKVPREFIQLNPLAVTPMSGQGKYLSHYKFFNGKTYEQIPKEDIIHFKNPDADNLLVGKPVLAKVFNQAEVDFLQTMYQKSFYEKGGFMGLTFSTEQNMSDTAFTRAWNMIRGRFSGAGQSYNVGLVDSGLKPINATHSIKDMDISQQRILTRDEITAAFEVQKLLLGIGEATNRATAEVAIYLFVSGVVDPYMDYIDQTLTNQLCYQFDESYYIKHDTLANKDVLTDLQYYANGIQNGWLTQNEVRELENYEELPIESMNVPLVKNPVNVTVN